MKNLIFALLALAAAGCSEPMQKGIETNEDIYNVTTSWEGVLDNNAHSLQLSFQATSSWEATVQDEAKSWLSVTPKSGASGLNKVLVNVKSNPTTEDRFGSLSIVPLIGEPYVVTVSQKKDPEAEDQDYTSFIFWHDEDVTFSNVVIGSYDTEGNCWAVAKLGDLSKGVKSKEIVINDEEIKELHFFSDYPFPSLRLEDVYVLNKNTQNIFKIRGDCKGIIIDNLDPKQYPQEKGAQ